MSLQSQTLQKKPTKDEDKLKTLGNIITASIGETESEVL